MRGGINKVGLPVAALAAFGALGAPFALFRANRIVAGEGCGITDALPASVAGLLLFAVAAGALVALLRTPAWARLLAAAVVVVLLFLALGLSPAHLTGAGDRYARVSPAAGFWLLLLAFAMLAADGLTRLRPSPALRVLLLAALAAGLALLLGSGRLDGLSILREYAGRADSFWREATRHVVLALGSLAAASLVGLPLGIACHRIRALREPILNVLNIVQTIPSIALFGLLIAPLGWIAAHVPAAQAIGLRGVGVAPALVALFLYSLLPVVASTVAGLAGVPRAADDAARGLGMSGRQRLFQVELPLAFPVILTGIRIVLVQNIGLATIAALIGGGGFGVFVFQGVGQTAMDLVLLGAVPTVALAFASAVVLDAAVDLASTPSKGRAP
ncbi:ABC transporter permease [Aureimonas pseudogalii]|uniref:Osmoprotectant transport system permease protein n=1 Tax=Aureimonas pseudogalii TaxID=1744844 RepID=A0A7W6MKI6_9HYPH|nr:ABC transporter permease [Aureimonas pseudogalii]MBB3999043.1 osmoprotectant transport system permease protein [Aureimonas pseudogalii]